MFSKQLKLMAILAGAGLGVLMITADADARWGSRGSWGSSGGSWGSSGGSWGGWGSWGGSGGSWGYARGHRRWRRYAYGSHGSWGSAGGSWGSSGGYAHAFSSYGSYGGTVISSEPSPASGGTDAAPAKPPAGDAGDGEAAPAASEDSSAGVANDSVLLSVTVPADAKVIINGHQTKTTGTSRSYVSRGLRWGHRYKYEIRAEVDRDGQQSSDTKVVYVTAGQKSRLAFHFAVPPAGEQPQERVVSQPDELEAAPKTTLRLRVPAAATVTLAGALTQAKGPERVFTTRRLAAGQTWDDYLIRAEFERDGRRLTKEVRIDLRAGETRDVAIDFDTADVAAVAAAATR